MWEIAVLIGRWALGIAAGVGLTSAFNKLFPGQTPTVTTDPAGNFSFMNTAKIIGIITLGAVALHLLMKVFKVKLFK